MASNKMRVPKKRSFVLVGGASAEVDVVTGEAKVCIPDVTDEIMGVGVSHVITDGDDFGYGMHMRLNLHESLEKVEDGDSKNDYVYTDALGDKHYFAKGYFYYSPSVCSEVEISESEVTVLADGRLVYDSESISGGTTRFDVKKREIAKGGLELKSRLENVKNIENYEQRSEEEAELSEKLSSYKEMICDFVAIKTDGVKVAELDKDTLEDDFESFIDTDGCYFMPRSEASSYAAAVEQKANLESQISYLKGLDTQRTYEMKECLREYANLNAYYKSYFSDWVVITSEGTAYISDITDEGISSFLGNSGVVLRVNEKDAYANGDSYIKRKYTESSEHNRNEIQKYYDAYKASKQLYQEKLRNFVLVNDAGEVQYTVNTSTNINSGSFLELCNSSYTLTEAEAIQLKSLNIQLQAAEEALNPQSSAYDTPLERRESQQEQLREYYRTYLALADKLEKMKLALPVNYIYTDSGIKGFNEYGELCVIYGKNGDYVVVEREFFYNVGNKLHRISSVYNKDESRKITLEYSPANQLSSITDGNGNRASYEYKEIPWINSFLKKVTYSDGTSLAISGSSVNAIQITDSYGNTAEISFEDAKAVGITVSSSISSVEHGSVTKSDTVNNGATVTLAYDENNVTITDENGGRVRYTFDSDENVISELEEKNGVVVSAKEFSYEYSDSDGILLSSVQTNCATEAILSSKSIGSFELSEFYTDYVNYDKLSRPVYEHKAPRKVYEDFQYLGTRGSDTTYVYDESRRLIEKSEVVVTSVSDAATDEITTEEKEIKTVFCYTPSGLLAKKEVSVIGEELTTGINIEEYEYDENGNETKAYSYNTLDPSSKLYTERVLNGDGQTVSEYDESGRYKTEYEYKSGTHTVISEKAPNGSKISYGYSPRDGKCSVTVSTEDGEENSTRTEYTNALATRVISGNNEIKYKYDHRGRVIESEINGNKYLTTEYVAEGACFGMKTNVIRRTYANEDTSLSIEDKYGNVINATFNSGDDTKTYVRELGEKLRTSYEEDTYSTGNQMTTYTYDKLGRITECKTEEYGKHVDSNTGEEYTSFDNVVSEKYAYKTNGLLKEKSYLCNGKTVLYEYSYKDNLNKDIESITVDGSVVVKPEADCLGRSRGKTVSKDGEKIASEDISYLKYGDRATNIPLKITYGNKTDNGFVIKDNIKYKYDEMGNICEVYENGVFSVSYEYDALCRLIRENNKTMNKTVLFSYDNTGNILSKTEYTFTLKETAELIENDGVCVDYSYDKDRLISYGSEAFTYDVLGNPTVYRGKTLSWNHGRNLAAYGDNVFYYNARGQRISKNDECFLYDCDGRLLATAQSENSSVRLAFSYDESGLLSIDYSDKRYFYRKDVLGNVTALLDSDGKIVVKYIYDAWGNHKVLGAWGEEITDPTHIGNVNPFRYRSYFYDTETGLYYLQSRYYDPEIARFINMDDISYADPESINGLNLYAYCGDNPIMYCDEYGYSPDSIWKTLLGVMIGVGLAIVTVAAVVASGGTLLVPVLVGAGVGAGLNLAGQGIANLKNGKGFFEGINWWNVCLGGLSGAAFATGAGGLLGAIAIGVTSNVGMSAFENNSWANIVFSAIVGGISASIGYGAGKLVSKYVPKNTRLTFKNYYELGIIGTNKFIAGVEACAAVSYTFLPTIAIGATRGVSKFVGNWIGDWF